MRMSMKTFWLCQMLLRESGEEKTYKCCRSESQDGSVQALDSGMRRWVEVCIQRYTLQAVHQPRRDSCHRVQSHGTVD
jgi:hypothetical protein